MLNLTVYCKMSSSFLKLFNHLAPPNQSLKLTEVAVDDLARAKQPVTIGLDVPRADWIPSLRRFAAAA